MEEKIFFKNSKGNKLCGILSNPTGDINNPIIILCHGFNSGKNSSSNLALVDELNKNNISSFRFDLFAHGESEGLFEDLTVTESVDDIICAIEYLKYLGYKKIGLEGSSFGGLAAFIAASKSKDLYLMAVKCPVSSYLEFTSYRTPEMVAEWKKNGFSIRENKKLNFTFYEDSIKNVAYDIANRIKVPTLIVHGDADQSVPIDQSIKISKLIPHCKLEIIKGGEHYYKDKNHPKFKEFVEKIINFIITSSN